MISKPEEKAYEKRRALILAHPDLLSEICAYVANGGTIITLADSWDIRYSDLTEWLHKDVEGRERPYMKAMNDRAEWGKERFLAEIRTIGLVNLKAAFNSDGTLKPIHDIPDDVMRCISGIEVDELFEGAGQERTQVGVTKKLKLESKLKALELAMKNAGMLVERHVIKTAKSMEELLAESNKEEPEADAGAGPKP